MIRAAALLPVAIALCACSEPVVLPALPAISTEGLQAPVADAISAAGAAVDAAPDNAGANGRLAMLLHVHDRPEAAAAVYRRARLLAPGELRWAYLHGDALEQSGQVADATEAFRAALEIDASALRARVRLADLLAGLGDIDTARLHYEAVLATEPQRTDALFGLGQLQNNNGDHAAAIETLHTLLQVGGDSGPAHYALSQAYQRNGDAEQAERHRQAFQRFRDTRIAIDDPLLQQALALRTGDRPHLERAGRLYAAGDLAGARAAYERAVAVNPTGAVAHANLVAIVGELEGVDAARSHYQRAVQLDPGVAVAHSNYGTVLLKAAQPALAEQAFRRAVAIDRADADVAANLGFAVELQQRHDEAESIYREALRRDSNHALANYLLGRRLLAGGDSAQAIRHLELSAAAESPHRLRALIELARAQRGNGNADAAIEALREAQTQAAQSGNTTLAGQLGTQIAAWEATAQ